jgi:uncharacterized protein (DUF58 family)
VFTRRGIAAIVIGVLFWIIGRVIGTPEFYLLGTGSLLLAAVCFFYVHIRRFDVLLARAAIPQRAHVGDQVTIYLRLQNRSRVPSPPLVIRDNVAEWGQARHLIEPISGRSRYEVHYRVPTPKRGRLYLGPAELAAIDPFGFAVRSRYVPEKTSLLVLPKIVPVVSPPIPGRSEITGVRQRIPVGADEDFALRKYNEGDDSRMIHWRSSARRGTLLVREPISTTPGYGAIVLDTTNPVKSSTFEGMVSFAASLLSAMYAEAIPFQLAYTDGFCSPIFNSDDGLALLLDRLAECSIIQREIGLTHELRSVSSVVYLTASLGALRSQASAMFTKSRHESSRIAVLFSPEEAIAKGVTVLNTTVETFAKDWNNAVGYRSMSAAR